MLNPITLYYYFFTIIGVLFILKTLREGYWRGVVSELIKIFKQSITKIVFGLIIVICIIAFVDLPVSTWCKTHLNREIYNLLDNCATIAEGWCVGGLIILILLIAICCKRERLAVVTKISIVALLYVGVINSILKCLFNRERPAIILDQWQFFHFFATGFHDFGQLIYASNSMPSGHAIAVWSAITPFLLYFRNIFLRYLLIVFGITICIARVYTLNHWVSDVCVGAALGMIVGIAAYKANKWRLEL